MTYNGLYCIISLHPAPVCVLHDHHVLFFAIDYTPRFFNVASVQVEQVRLLLPLCLSPSYLDSFCYLL